MNLYLSDEELIVLSTSLDHERKLDEVKLLIGKENVSQNGLTVIAASYTGDEVLDVKFTPLTDSFATGSIVTASGMGLDMTNATEVKIMLWSDMRKLVPVTAYASIN